MKKIWAGPAKFRTQLWTDFKIIRILYPLKFTLAVAFSYEDKTLFYQGEVENKERCLSAHSALCQVLKSDGHFKKSYLTVEWILTWTIDFVC